MFVDKIGEAGYCYAKLVQEYVLRVVAKRLQCKGFKGRVGASYPMVPI